MWNLRDKCAIAGIGCTTFSKNSGVTVLELTTEACQKAAADAGMTLDEIDGIISFNFNDSVPSMSVATALGLPNPQYVVEFSSGGNAANLVALVELDEGVRLPSNIVDCPPEEVTGGMRVQVVFHDINEEVSLPQFKPSVGRA